MNQTLLKLLCVSGLLKSKPAKISLKTKTYLYMLVFPIFLIIIIRAYIVLWRARTINERKNNAASYKYHLTIAAIAKNESEHIGEWLAFHKLQGVEKVFLYDNDSTDNMYEVLKPYIDDGFVEYNEIHGKCIQFAAYTDAINRYGKLTEYMAFIDCDEFMVPVDTDSNLRKIIDDVFAKDDNAGGYAVNWCIYGSSGLEKKPQNGLLIENFIYHSDVSYVHNKHIKSIVRPSCVKYFNHPHYPIYKSGYYCINYDGDIVPSWWNNISAYNGIKLNHYFCKSKEEFVKRRSLGRADIPTSRTIDEFYEYDKNDVKDEDISMYFADLEKLMNNYTIH